MDCREPHHLPLSVQQRRPRGEPFLRCYCFVLLLASAPHTTAAQGGYLPVAAHTLMCELSSSRGPLLQLNIPVTTHRKQSAAFTAKHAGNYVLSRGEEGEEDLCGGEGESDGVAPQDTSEVNHATAAPASLFCKSSVHVVFLHSVCCWHAAANPVNSRPWRNSCGGLIALCLRVGHEQWVYVRSHPLLLLSSAENIHAKNHAPHFSTAHRMCAHTTQALLSSTAPSTDQLRS